MRVRRAAPSDLPAFSAAFWDTAPSCAAGSSQKTNVEMFGGAPMVVQTNMRWRSGGRWSVAYPPAIGAEVAGRYCTLPSDLCDRLLSYSNSQGRVFLSTACALRTPHATCINTLQFESVQCAGQQCGVSGQ